MARERRLGRKREGGWWILNSAGESFQRGKMKLPLKEKVTGRKKKELSVNKMPIDTFNLLTVSH